MNWGGGWSDTPPYCNEKGGTVLNAAILLNGEKPVEVTLESIPEQKVVFDSRDMDVHGEFDTIEPLQATGDPYDPFALQKACLLACGIIPREGHTLGEILERLGSGFVMHSEVRNVPKGSGLGTSSILSAACVKAVFEFMGIAYYRADRMAFRVLLCMDGCGTISYDEGTVNFYKGDCVFVPADSEVLTIHGQAQFLDIRG